MFKNKLVKTSFLQCHFYLKQAELPVHYNRETGIDVVLDLFPGQEHTPLCVCVPATGVLRTQMNV